MRHKKKLKSRVGREKTGDGKVEKTEDEKKKLKKEIRPRKNSNL